MSFIILWGTGNPLFGDDGVGPFVAQYLQKKEMEHPICAINCETTPENYIGDLQRRHPAYSRRSRYGASSGIHTSDTL